MVKYGEKSYVAFVLSIFVPHLSVFSCIGKAVLRDVTFPGYLYLYFGHGTTDFILTITKTVTVHHSRKYLFSTVNFDVNSLVMGAGKVASCNKISVTFPYYISCKFKTDKTQTCTEN